MNSALKCLAVYDSSSASGRLAQNPVQDIPPDVRQAALNPIVVVGQVLVVDPRQVQHRSVEIVPVHPILDRPVADVVRRTISSCRPN